MTLQYKIYKIMQYQIKNKYYIEQSKKLNYSSKLNQQSNIFITNKKNDLQLKTLYADNIIKNSHTSFNNIQYNIAQNINNILFPLYFCMNKHNIALLDKPIECAIIIYAKLLPINILLNKNTWMLNPIFHETSFIQYTIFI
jgi:hypothetical protein